MSTYARWWGTAALTAEDAEDAEYRSRNDLLVEDLVIVELEAVAELRPIHEAQLLSYLELFGRHVGLLINVNVKLLKSGIRRLVNELPE